MIKELSPNETTIIISCPISEIESIREAIKCLLFLSQMRKNIGTVPDAALAYARLLYHSLAERSDAS